MTDSGPSHNKDSGYIGDDGLGKEVHQSRFPLRTLRPRHNLPPTSTSFVGRENELRIILKQLGERDCRLLTLVGMGGIGKTRLALVAAEQLVDAFEHGVFFVSLAPLRSPNDIVPSIAGALHVPLEASGGSDRQQLLDYLDERELLLVLDNLEHLLDDVTLVDALLSGAPRVKVLATSREPLNLGWECLFEVGGLEMPATGEDDDAETFAAVRLFVERAVRVQPSFKLAGEYVSVIEIIRRVGGVFASQLK